MPRRTPPRNQINSSPPTAHDQRGRKRKKSRSSRSRSTLAIKKKDDMVTAAVKKKY